MRQFELQMCAMAVVVWLGTCGLLGCSGAGKPSAPAPLGKPVLIAGASPLPAFVAEQRLLAGPQRTLVYVGASWCEPCQRFHKALLAGELDESLRGVRLVEYDLDAARGELTDNGYSSRLIPLFARPNADGRCGTARIEGSIKGEGAVAQLVPRLQQLLATP